ncbi:uncharacterized protein LOC127151069 [Cucumis melo]|uniref:Uncharacterized protein LOC127151069 n=1 Tax=Cucumis melo TaxID=3656 RepID=A0ABM3L8R1_CUCME|nr:uncharacterized protein LOC127151069 [Cucumis melo]
MDHQTFLGVLTAFTIAQHQMLLTLEALVNDNKRFPQTPYDIKHRIRQLAYFRMIHESDLVCSESTRMAVLVHDMKNCVIQGEFVRFGETVSPHFNVVLLAVLRLYNALIKKPVPVTNNCIDQHWKCFEIALGHWMRCT